MTTLQQLGGDLTHANDDVIEPVERRRQPRRNPVPVGWRFARLIVLGLSAVASLTCIGALASLLG